jgi:hypothetical protein
MSGIKTDILGEFGRKPSGGRVKINHVRFDDNQEESEDMDVVNEEFTAKEL